MPEAECDTRRAVVDALLLKSAEQLSHIVDGYVMGVTQSLCVLENEYNVVMQMPEFNQAKARILEELEALDRAIADYRDTVASEPVPSLGS